MKPRILLINPPIYDFTAYDFWLKPYGLLQVAGQLEGLAELTLFDYLDRIQARTEWPKSLRQDSWHRGPFPQQRMDKPQVLSDIPRYYHRFGRDRGQLHAVLKSQGPFDFVLIQTVMTYWYPGVVEVITDIRRFCPKTRIVLGGLYSSICPEHVSRFGADLVIQGSQLTPLYDLLDIPHNRPPQPAWWKGYPSIETAAITITHGCPFRCTYCSVPMMAEGFSIKPIPHCVSELKSAIQTGAQDIAFYDDALLYHPESGLLRFLEAVESWGIRINFHTPNALHARFLTSDVAHRLVHSGVKTFYLGFESTAADWHNQTGRKVSCDDLANAVEHLCTAGAVPSDIAAYQIIGHPDSDIQQLEETMEFIHSLRIRIMLADFSPIPGTFDGNRCKEYTDLSEPLNHNKTAFTIRRLGSHAVSELKARCRQLNELLLTSS